MLKVLALFFCLTFPVFVIAEPGKFEFKAADLMEKQKFTEWNSHSSVKPFIAMNGRPFAMTMDDFADVIRNTFHQCNDMDAYMDRKGSKEACQAYIYQGMREWVELSKDSRVSYQAWKMGTAYAFNTDNPFPSNNIFDFNGWAAGIRVAKSKGY